MKKIALLTAGLVLSLQAMATAGSPTSIDSDALPSYVSANAATKSTPGSVFGFVGKRTTSTSRWRVTISNDATDTLPASTIVAQQEDLGDTEIDITLPIGGVKCDTGIYIDVDNCTGTIYYK